MPRRGPVSRKKFEKFLKHIGCYHKRTEGDHLVWDKPGLKRQIIFTIDKEVPLFHIRRNLNTLGISLEDFYKIIEKL